jgi:hypothetical protein
MLEETLTGSISSAIKIANVREGLKPSDAMYAYHSQHFGLLYPGMFLPVAAHTRLTGEAADDGARTVRVPRPT